jgi:hypothetical protein
LTEKQIRSLKEKISHITHNLERNYHRLYAIDDILTEALQTAKVGAYTDQKENQ